MIHQTHCRQCNEQLLETTSVGQGVMVDVANIPPGIFLDEATGRYYKTCPHCGARNGFRPHKVPGRGDVLLLDGLLD